MKKNDEEKLRVTMIVSLKETVTSMAKILKIIEVMTNNESWMAQQNVVYLQFPIR